MNVLRIQSVGQLVTSANHTRTKVTGTLQIGATNSVSNFAKETHTSYARKVLICDTAGTATLDLTDASVTGSAVYVPPVAQADTVVATGTATASGVLGFRITSVLYADLPSSYKTFSIPISVTGSLSATDWATVVRSTLAANADFSALWTVGGSGVNILVTHVIDQYGYAEDATFLLQILIFSGMTGVTASSSTGTVTGSLATGTLWEETDTVDAEGVDLPAMETTAAATLVNCSRGIGTLEDAGADFVCPIVSSSFLLFSNGNTTTPCGFDTSIIATCATPPLELIYTVTAKIA